MVNCKHYEPGVPVTSPYDKPRPWVPKYNRPKDAGIAGNSLTESCCIGIDNHGQHRLKTVGRWQVTGCGWFKGKALYLVLIKGAT